ncbi:hypothetical protein BV898_07173 [Hypsibius exemplaris]|uniref:Invertebrate defensins family profile domain-containing protein n=1 Tax=Hypsibius exemplaris TaxID=2072580 RepID=A0A1W0WU49_HYPEX|nr:hypothetical protein BV898_07173 [Hypsibius exemplaris]
MQSLKILFLLVLVMQQSASFVESQAMSFEMNCGSSNCARLCASKSGWASSSQCSYDRRRRSCFCANNVPRCDDNGACVG